MKAAELCTYLRDRGVSLWIDDDRLRYRAPKGVLTPALRADLAAHKSEIMALLRESDLAASLDALPLRRISREEKLPLSFIQERLWFLDQLDPGIPAYNIPLAYRMTGPLDVAALEYSFNALLRRHEIMRASCTAAGGQPSLVIAPESVLSLPVIDLRELPQAEREVTVLQLITEEARKPFDLSQSPLLRVTLYWLDEEEVVLLISTHHFVADGWSLGIFFSELSAFYQSYLDRRQDNLPEISIQYVDFSHWQRERIQGGLLEKESAYWKHRLAGAPAALDLPTDHPRPPAQTYRGAKQPLALSAHLTDALKALSRKEQVTLFMTLLAGLQTLLFRYTHQDDVVVGTHVSNRNRIESEALVGSFANSVVLRSDLSADPTFRALLHSVHEKTIQDYARQEFPFEMLVEALQPERDMSRPPLFQVSFLLHQRAQDQRLQLAGLSLVDLPVELGTSRYDLFLEMEEVAGELVGTLEYSTDLFEPGTIARMVEHYRILLQGIVADPEQHISALPLLTEGERQQLLVDWNDTQADYPADSCIHHLFEAQVRQRPEATAVVFEDENLTYAELNQRANQVAHHLLRLGVGPGTLVGIFLERSLEMVVGLLGVLKAGGTYVPLDPTFPTERLAFMVQDTQMSVLLTQQSLLSALPENHAHITCLDRDWVAVSGESPSQPLTPTLPGDIAYVIHTSGSTGRPKGVQISHSAVVNFLEHMRREPGLGERDRLLAVTTISFDIAALELFLPLSVGARLILASRHVAYDGMRLPALMSESGATVLQATPATWHMLLDSGWQGDPQLKILCGGEALPRDLADRLLDKGSSLWNLYGPTETTIWSTVERVKPGTRAVPIGRPLANTVTHLLDSRLQPVPIGVPGELYIGGVGLAEGYLNRPELTAERFVPHPFSDEPGARLYRTGDLARYLPDGRIEFLGRIDHQVKVRGFRIELGEIETVLSQHPAVRQTVVLAREDMPGDKRLVAYVVPNQEPVPEAGELRGFLASKLPDFMVPSAFALLESLPLTPNGKVNRRALPPPDWSSRNLEQLFVAPRTPVEEILAESWVQVLGVERVGIHDDFFELGGHSLLATRLISRVRDDFQVELSLRNMFENPTIAGLAQSIEIAKWALESSEYVSKGDEPEREEFEL